MGRYLAIFSFLTLLVFSFTTPACSFPGETTEERPLALVDGYPVTHEDVEAVAPEGSMTCLEAEEALRRAVRRRALINRALKMGLEDDPGYQKEMRGYREHALVKTLLERKSEEIASKTTVSDEEAAGFAAGKCFTLVFFVNEYGTEKEAAGFMAKAAGANVVEWEDEGVLAGCGGYGPRLERELYEMEAGDIKLVTRGRRYSVIKLISREKAAVDPELKDMDKLKEYLLSKKTEAAMEDWVESVIKEADVEIPGGGDGCKDVQRPAAGPETPVGR